MAFQAQTTTFTIAGSGTTTADQTVTFVGNSITNNQVAAAIQSINLSYSDGNDDHESGIIEVVPSVGAVTGTSATISITVRVGDKYSANHVMSGTVTVVAMADVN